MHTKSEKGENMTEYEFTRDITCPYCGCTNGDGWEIEKNVYDGDLGIITCDKCEKRFSARRNMEITYSTEKCPCQNGEEHNFRPICGAPKEYWANKEECSVCGERRTKLSADNNNKIEKVIL